MSGFNWSTTRFQSYPSINITLKNELNQELLQTRQKILEAQNERITQQQKEKEILLIKFQQSKLYQEIWTSSNSEGSNSALLNNPGKWIELQQHIDGIYPHFTDYLKRA